MATKKQITAIKVVTALTALIFHSCFVEESNVLDNQSGEVSTNDPTGVSKNDDRLIAERTFNDVMRVTDRQFIGSCKVGEVYGDATLIFSSNLSVNVNYSALGYSAVEYGDLNDMSLETDGELGTYIIRANWDNKVAGDGTFTMKVLNEEFPKNVYVSIRGSGWAYYSYLELSNEQFEKVKLILKDPNVNQNQETKIEKINESPSYLIQNTDLNIAYSVLDRFSQIVMDNNTNDFPEIFEREMDIYHSKENISLSEIMTTTEKSYFSKWLVLNDSIITIRPNEDDNYIFEYEKYYVIQRKSDGRILKYSIKGICGIDESSKKLRVLRDTETKKL